MNDFDFRPTDEEPLLILAMDHRDSFQKLLGIADPPSEDDLSRMRRVKGLIYDGLTAARPDLGVARPGVLVDEHLGAEVLRRASADGVVVAMPVERSGQRLFQLEYGAQTRAHVEEFDPSYTKILVRMNPADDAADQAAQLAAVAELSKDLKAWGQRLIYELLVPATDEQAAAAGGSDGYDRDVRPQLVGQVIAANQGAGIEPALWKIEGLETKEAAESVVAAAKAGGRDADCIVLGRDAPVERLDHWLQVAAGVPGFVGFAIGRSIWEDAVTAHAKNGDDDALVSAVAANYRHFAQVYLDAR